MSPATRGPTSPRSGRATSSACEGQASQGEEPRDEGSDEEVLRHLVDADALHRRALVPLGLQLRETDQPLGRDDESGGRELTGQAQAQDEEALHRPEQPAPAQLVGRLGLGAIPDPVDRSHRANADEDEPDENVCGGQVHEQQPEDEEHSCRGRAFTDDGKVGPLQPLLEQPARSGSPPREGNEPDGTGREGGQSRPVARTRGHRLGREPDPQGEGDDGGGEGDEVGGSGEPGENGDHRDHAGTDENRAEHDRAPQDERPSSGSREVGRGDADEPDREPGHGSPRSSSWAASTAPMPSARTRWDTAEALMPSLCASSLWVVSGCMSPLNSRTDRSEKEPTRWSRQSSVALTAAATEEAEPSPARPSEEIR